MDQVVEGFHTFAASTWAPLVLEKAFTKKSKGVSGRILRKFLMLGFRFNRRKDKGLND